MQTMTRRLVGVQIALRWAWQVPSQHRSQYKGDRPLKSSLQPPLHVSPKSAAGEGQEYMLKLF